MRRISIPSSVGVEPIAVYAYNVQTGTYRLRDIIFNYRSVIWTRKINDYSKCEIWLELNEHTKEYIKVYNVLARDAEHSFVITSVTYERTENGDLSIHATGYTLEYLMTFRVFDGTYFIRGSRRLYEIARSFVSYFFGSQNVYAGRRAQFSYDSYATPSSISISMYTRTGGTMLEAMQELVLKDETANLFFKVKASVNNGSDYMYPTMGLYAPVDRSKTVVFNNEMNAIASSSLIMDETSVKNVAYVYGEDRGTERKFEVVEAFGYDSYTQFKRRELYVDARDLQSTVTTTDGQTITLTDAEYRQRLRERGVEKLSQYVPSTNYSAIISDNTKYVYGTDYSVGDLVKISDSVAGVEAIERVTGYEETETANEGKKLKILIGQQQVTLKDSIKRML